MTLDQIAFSAAGLFTVTIGGWTIRTLYQTVQVVAVLQARISEHERRISRLEGRERTGTSANRRNR